MNIGISACFFHADPNRPIFTGKTLVYAEKSLVHWVMSDGDLAFLLPPRPDHVALERYVAELDGLVLEGGSDVCPATYGEQPLRPEWNGDHVRDLYEIELVRAFVAAGKPVLGVCRGMQLLNVAFGGTLWQDIRTQVDGSLVHRDAALYDQLFHTIRLEPGTELAALYGGTGPYTVNSVHHQGVKVLAEQFVVEARSVDDGIIEAIRWTGPSFVMGVQWHPEFQDARETRLLDTKPLLRSFLTAARTPTEVMP